MRSKIQLPSAQSPNLHRNISVRIGRVYRCHGPMQRRPDITCSHGRNSQSRRRGHRASKCEFLVCRRRAGKSKVANGSFPACPARSRQNESAEQALARELAEELNVHDAEVLDLVKRQTTESNGQLIDLACYRVSTRCSPTRSTDHDALKWCPTDQLPALDWALPDLTDCRFASTKQHSSTWPI